VKAWLDRTFKLRNASGASVTMTARGVLDTVGQLDYTYESLPVRAGLGEEQPEVPSKRRRPVLIGASDTSVEVTRQGATAQVSVSPLPESAAAAVDDTRTYLNVTDIEGSQNPGVVFGVYLNLPADASEDVRKDHLAGAVSFFGIELTDPGSVAANKDEPHGMRYTFDVTELINRLRSQGHWQPGQLTVTMLPATSDGELEPAAAAATPPIRVGTFSLYQG
jgi:tyrosinase